MCTTTINNKQQTVSIVVNIVKNPMYFGGTIAVDSDGSSWSQFTVTPALKPVSRVNNNNIHDSKEQNQVSVLPTKNQLLKERTRQLQLQRNQANQLNQLAVKEEANTHLKRGGSNNNQDDKQNNPAAVQSRVF
jgi:5-enolpyruvylshikimate-3-phosphate synthase